SLTSFYLLILRPLPTSTLFPYTTLFRSQYFIGRWSFWRLCWVGYLLCDQIFGCGFYRSVGGRGKSIWGERDGCLSRVFPHGFSGERFCKNTGLADSGV